MSKIQLHSEEKFECPGSIEINFDNPNNPGFPGDGYSLFVTFDETGSLEKYLWITGTYLKPPFKN